MCPQGLRSWASWLQSSARCLTPDTGESRGGCSGLARDHGACPNTANSRVANGAAPTPLSRHLVNREVESWMQWCKGKTESTDFKEVFR